MRKSATKVFLLVEDDPNDVMLVEFEFKKMPHLLLRVVRDGQEAIDYLLGKNAYCDRTEHPIPDVILLDIKMPRLSGLQFLQWLHRQKSNHLRLIPVIVMSSSDHPKDVEKAYALGANLYMTKPVDWPLFRERMRLVGALWAEHAETVHH